MERAASKARISSYLSPVFRIILGAMFLYAGVTHALDPQGFATAVANYRILPGALVNPFAVVLPWLEMISGVTLILGIFIPGSTLMVAGLLF
ncbi:MAG TPA: MauE/DoxX family redox-associated membrane protein, partial [Desulfomonilia bacterium]|nr:MauE/DoxX family redox-associated membrane protein [Desulfomonilia bacterium]